jgi:hypothetical protein
VEGTRLQQSQSHGDDQVGTLLSRHVVMETQHRMSVEESKGKARARTDRTH